MRKMDEAKIREKAKKQRLIEKEEKRKWLEYLKQFQNNVLAKDAIFLGGTEASQVVESKYKEYYGNY